MAIDPARVKSLFLAASDMSSIAERAAYLDHACGDEPELRDRVEALLAADTPAAIAATGSSLAETVEGPRSSVVANDFSDALTMDSDAPEIAETPTPHNTSGFIPGQVIADRYTLLEILGEGGMGTVYRAEQARPVKRQVALKLIRGGMDSRAVLARFDTERQALAIMDHPNIARVYDGGTTQTGQPFFVMELVRGVSFTDYCDKHRLALEARLGLFVVVCQAVQHAHQKGIIHRDLKPSNVLITEVDGRPTPKVIDFGVAKATELDLSDQTLADNEAIVGTPTYMSPEQANPASMDIDTRADIYALGVILYELLAGSPPLDASQFKRGALLEMLRMVREVDPPRPSTRVSTANALPSIAATRDIDPDRLKRQLRGDLDWIAMKALEKDRNRRYETANAFAADILRHLSDEPVLAAPPSQAYRLKKFARKHRGPVVAAVLILMVLLGGIAGTTLGLFQANKSAEAANTARDHEAEQRRNAVSARNIAEHQSDTAGRNLYIAQMTLARQAWESTDAPALKEFLARQLPLAGGKDYRGWEWHYLEGQCHTLVTLRGSTETITSIAWSPDGQRVAASGASSSQESGEIKVWDAGTGRALASPAGKFRYGVQVLSWSPDGQRLAGGGGPLSGFNNDLPGELRIWDGATGKELRNLAGHKGYIDSVAWSHDGGRLAAASGEFGPPGNVKIWNTTTGAKLFDLVGHTNQVNRVAWSPDDKYVASTCSDGTIKIWDTLTGKEIRTLSGHKLAVYDVIWSPDGKQLATTSADPSVKIWNLADGKVAQSLAYTPDSPIVWRADSSALEIADIGGTIKVWDLATRQFVKLTKLNTPWFSLGAWSAQHDRLALANGDQTIRLIDVDQTPEAMVLKTGASEVFSVAWSRDGQRLATTGNNIKIWDKAGRQVQTSPREAGWIVIASAWSPDGRRLASSSPKQAGGTIKISDTASGNELFVWNAHIGAALSVAWNADGTRLATGGADHMVKVWDPSERDKEITTFKGHTGMVYSVAWQPGRARLASAGEDGTIRIWEMDRQIPAMVLGHEAGEIRSIAWSPDGRQLAAATTDGITLWDPATQQPLAHLRGHSGPVAAVAWRPDVDPAHPRLASVGADGTLKIWDLVARQEALTLHAGKGHLVSVAWSPDGQSLVAGADDGSVKVWTAAEKR